KAVHQLHNGIYYIRKALSEYSISKAQICISGSYCLKLGDVDCDVALFEKYMAENKELSVSELEHITSIYKGDYFAGEDWVWIDYDREVFLRHYSNAMIRLAEKYLTGRQAEKAELILLKAFNINPYEENITALLMELYKASGKKAEAAKHYKAFEKLLKQDLGIYPSDKIRESFYSIN
ncbi:MAG: BTAD domain-containing putative transcriptional regulator, partial [Oscillospiraceae bacterium]